ncbi:MAG: B-box zinc finger protein [Candidatus Acidiferrales bacterium]
MKCAHHPEVDSVAYCRQCGKGLCADCRRDVKGVIYCEDCLAASVLPAGAAPAVPGAPNPGLALALGFIPGVGAIYNGEYVKAFIFIFIFGGLISIIDSGAARGLEPLIGMSIFGFYVYMVLDSYHSAKRRVAGAAPASPPWESLGLGDAEKATPIGPLVLIVLGGLFLMNTLDFFPLRFLWRFWPAILIALGVWMLWKRTGGESRGRE